MHGLEFVYASLSSYFLAAPIQLRSFYDQFVSFDTNLIKLGPILGKCTILILLCERKYIKWVI